MILYNETLEYWYDDDDPELIESMAPNILGIYPKFENKREFYLWFECDCDMGCFECIGKAQM